MGVRDCEGHDSEHVCWIVKRHEVVAELISNKEFELQQQQLEL